MAGLLFTVLLAVLALAAAAAGFVNGQFALFWWVLAGVFAVATAVAWYWERRDGRKQAPSIKAGKRFFFKAKRFKKRGPGGIEAGDDAHIEGEDWDWDERGEDQP